MKTNNAVYGSHLGGIILVALTQVKTMALCHTLEVERKRHNYKIQTEERLAEVWRDKCKHQASEAKKKWLYGLMLPIANYYKGTNLKVQNTS